MTTINDLAVVSSVSSADKLALWQNANGVTRALPVSVLDGRYVTQDEISLLAIIPTPEVFVAGDGIAPNTFVPGVTMGLTLANLYGSAANIEIHFDGTFQGFPQYTLVGYGVGFSSPIPFGTSIVEIRGGSARQIGVPGAGTVVDASIAAGTVLSRRMTDVIHITDFAGIVGDDVNDDTAAANIAISVARVSGKPLYCPTPLVAYRFTSTINIGGNFAFHGDGVQPYVDNTNVTISHTTIGKGSWFHIDHPGVGFSAVGATQAFSVTYKGVGTIRNQPTPNGAAAFTPAANDYDFFNNNVDLFMDDVFCLNPTKFSYTTGGGRAVYRRVRGQPLQKGIYTDTAFDVCRYGNIHFWPWWSQAQGVYAYTLANANAMTFARNDTPVLEGIFTYGYFAALAITSNANGTTTRLTCTNMDVDFANYGLYIDGSVHGFTGSFANYTAQGSDSASNSSVFTAPGSSACEIRMENHHHSHFGGNGVRIDGTNNFFWAGSNSKVQEWNLVNGTFSAFAALPGGNTINFGYPPFAVAPTGAGLPLGGGGTFAGTLGRGKFAGTTNTAGLITVAHNLGAVPTGVIITPVSTGLSITHEFVSADGANFNVVFYNSVTGVGLNTVAVTFIYEIIF